MVQLWKLVLLCGLLAGTSESLLDIRGNDVLRRLISGLERGLGTFDSTIERLDMLSRLVITFLPRSKRLLISWLQSPSAVILEPPKIKSDTVSTVSPSISYEVMGPDAMIFVF